MAKTINVKKSRKAYKCSVCGEWIPVGSSYKHVSPRYRAKVIAHVTCNIPLHMISSSKLVPVWEGQQAVSNATTPEDISSALNDLASTAREVSEEYRNSAENQKEYFPDSEQASEWEEWADNLDSWADELEEQANEIDGLDRDEILAEKTQEVRDEGDLEDEDEIIGEAESRTDDEMTEKAQELAEIADECPC